MRTAAACLLACMLASGCGESVPMPSSTVSVGRSALHDRVHGQWLGLALGTAAAHAVAARAHDDRPLVERDWQALGLTLGDVSPLPLDPLSLRVASMVERSSPSLPAERLRDSWPQSSDPDLERARSALLEGVEADHAGLCILNPSCVRSGALAYGLAFSLLAPGQPDRALDWADPLLHALAAGHALHAAQWPGVLASLAFANAPDPRSAEATMIWLEAAAAYFPERSRASEVVRQVMADYLAAGADDTWERARDRLAASAVAGPAGHGVHELGVVVLALLHGRGDFVQTTRIAALAGHAPSTAAVAAALLGGVLGGENLRRQVPTASTSYAIDAETIGSFDALTASTLEQLEAELGRADGFVIPRPPESVAASRHNPSVRRALRSANLRQLRRGEQGLPGSSSADLGADALRALVDGAEIDARGEAEPPSPSVAAAGHAWFEVRYAEPVPALHLLALLAEGAVVAPSFSVLIDDEWRPVEGGFGETSSPTPATERVLFWRLPRTLEVHGVRLEGDFAPGARLVELDVLAPE